MIVQTYAWRRSHPISCLPMQAYSEQEDCSDTADWQAILDKVLTCTVFMLQCPAVLSLAQTSAGLRTISTGMAHLSDILPSLITTSLKHGSPGIVSNGFEVPTATPHIPCPLLSHCFRSICSCFSVSLGCFGQDLKAGSQARQEPETIEIVLRRQTSTEALPHSTAEASSTKPALTSPAPRRSPIEQPSSMPMVAAQLAYQVADGGADTREESADEKMRNAAAESC